MKRVNFHLTDKQIASLQRMSTRTGLPAAELVRRAVDAMLAGQSTVMPVDWSIKGATRNGQGKKSPNPETAARL